MTKEEIIKYVTSSPENTNPNVLRGMLENNGQGGGSGGANVLTLYADFREYFDGDRMFAWLDENKTTEFDSSEEAYAACAGADIIKVIDLDTPGNIYFATALDIREGLPVLSVLMTEDGNTTYGMRIYLFFPSQ